MNLNKTPGVYIKGKIPPSIESVKTAIPAFIGYTQKAELKKPGDLINQATRIESMLEYEKYFGLPQPETGITITINTTEAGPVAQGKITNPSNYLMYYSLQMYFINNGGPCYIVSVGDYNNSDFIDRTALQSGLDDIAETNEITLILFPDAINLDSASDYYTLQKKALEQAAKLKDRFVVMDVWIDADDTTENVQVLRDFDFGNAETAKYGAAYYPRIFTHLNYKYEEKDIGIIGIGNESLSGSLTELKSKKEAYFYYMLSRSEINNIEMLMPASSAVAGKYVEVDNTSGVWKAPANIGIDYAVRPEKVITQNEQRDLNVDSKSGKSINTLRSFAGRGPAIIWGARTLAGNDKDWQYISVCRFFNMVEESTRKATEQFVSETNERATWIKVKSMIENYLTSLWKSGALTGTTPQEAYFVKLGLGETMTGKDVEKGLMIVEIGMAVVRPAEFTIIRFIQQLQRP
ncbi:MAG TPA: phage tail sheath C-terminal domain-containing protein [Balneolaceae bacterium]|nr:phage tail sheath C-terminal domain-containing protein [Balneolaceae bacterium]